MRLQVLQCKSTPRTPAEDLQASLAASLRRWNPLNQRTPEHRDGDCHLAELAEGSGVDQMAREGADGRDWPQTCIPLSFPPRPFPASAPGSWLTSALHVWDGWGSESPRGREGSAQSQVPAVFSLSPCQPSPPETAVLVSEWGLQSGAG